MGSKPRIKGPLTSREQAVLGKFAQGLDHRDAAVALGVTEKTVNQFSSHAAQKLGLKSRHGERSTQMFLAAYGTTQSLAGVVELVRRGMALSEQARRELNGNP